MLLLLVGKDILTSRPARRESCFVSFPMSASLSMVCRSVASFVISCLDVLWLHLAQADFRMLQICVSAIWEEMSMSINDMPTRRLLHLRSPSFLRVTFMRDVFQSTTRNTGPKKSTVTNSRPRTVASTAAAAFAVGSKRGKPSVANAGPTFS